jgi:ABC-type transport system substrate-binding protein
MAAAGKTRVDFELMTNPGDPAYSKIAQLMQQNLREVGMHARIQQVAVPDFIDRVWTKGQFEVVTSWMAGFTDPGMVPPVVEPRRPPSGTRVTSRTCRR